MNPTVEQLKAICPGIDEALVAHHIGRLADSYFSTFDLQSVCGHIALLAELTPAEPVRVTADRDASGQVDCTVLAFDYPFEFSLITGLLTGAGFNIVSGQVFTYAPAEPAAGRHDGRSAQHALLQRRRIIDCLTGTLDSDVDIAQWRASLTAELRRVMNLLENGRADSLSQAKHFVNEKVARILGRARSSRAASVLYPVNLSVDNDSGPCTTLKVTSQDTPAFLYSLSSALSSHQVSIEHVRIQTVKGKARDEIDILDSSGRKVTDEERLDQIRFSVLLTKQFTHFLGTAPDPFAALSRFERLLSEVLQQPGRGKWLELFSSPAALKNLARILGASTFIWEDFVRSQYEVVLPILDKSSSKPGRWSVSDMQTRIEQAMKNAADTEQKRLILNDFKDREIFLIDLDHMMHADVDPRVLADPLTRLAEVVVSKAVEIVHDRLVRRFGVPRTVGGLEARWAVFGLGKFGGEALGYASDIELLFVYSDNGKTDRGTGIANSDFFSRLAMESASFITAKREGIFRVDLRLRPHGHSGPAACSLENFCRYYGPTGGAHLFERLALTRLRGVAGDADLGKRVERLRDEFVYGGKLIELRELQRLRSRQFEEKVPDRRPNAKFSPGALVDVEYYVQVLQIVHGKADARLRTPRIRDALSALTRAGVIKEDEGASLTDAYYFLRRLVNGLRMLRGNALDLFLPPADSDEYGHLARRMGYRDADPLNPQRSLHVDFETHTATVRMFIERHFGREILPDPAEGNVADLVLSDSVPRNLPVRVLRKAGFEDPARAFTNLRAMAGDGNRRTSFARLAVLACDILKTEADPDMALNNWERFVAAIPDPEAHFQILLSQPRRLDILLGIFAGSQFLSDTLVRSPEFLEWVTDPANLHGTRSADRTNADLAAFTKHADSFSGFLDGIRRFRRREILRIGARDICLHVPLEAVTADLSTLADGILDSVLDQLWKRDDIVRAAGNVTGAGKRFCIMALGKLGGRELNYSSDVDLLAVYDQPDADKEAAAAARLYHRIMEQLRSALSDHTEEGYVYRVDLRLRPHGSSASLAQPVSALAEYYSSRAALWEIQALLKVRPVAGNIAVGARFAKLIQPVIAQQRDRVKVIDSIRRMRNKAVQSKAATKNDIKDGPGGIRDIEFLVQAHQLLNAADHPEVLTGNTLSALTALRTAGILPVETAGLLKKHYVFLRRVEHALQILEDRQTHTLPKSDAQISALARRAMGPGASAASFGEAMRITQQDVRDAYAAMFGKNRD